jgi:hypothetical protein
VLTNATRAQVKTERKMYVHILSSPFYRTRCNAVHAAYFIRYSVEKEQQRRVLCKDINDKLKNIKVAIM